MSDDALPVVKDIAVHVTSSYPGIEEDLRLHPPHKDQVWVTHCVWIGQLPNEQAKTILDMCEGLTLRGSKIARTFEQRYAFVLENNTHGGWDGAGLLQLALGLSRLIRPTSLGFEHAARLIYLDGRLHNAWPIRVASAGAWTAGLQRNWMTTAEVESLRVLHNSYSEAVQQNRLPDRVERALWMHEYVARSGEAPLRWALVATGLECLLHTDERKPRRGPGSTRQFRKRCAMLSERLVMPSVTEAEAEDFYELRSAVTHGRKIDALRPSDLALYVKMEDLLRGAIRRSILETDTRQLFESDEHVRRAFPIES